MRAMITGGTGFIGRKLSERLLAQGEHVRLLVRPQSTRKARDLAERGAEIMEGDILDRPSILNAAEGCDTVFHVAALVGAGLPTADFYRHNVDGTDNVLHACEQAHIHRLVHVSTQSVLVDFADQRGDEALPYPAQYKDAYSETKAAGERAVLAAHAAGHVSAAIIRPCWVWGAGDTSILPALLQLAKPGLFTWISGSRKYTSTSHVDNVVEMMVLAAQRTEAGGEVFFVTDDEDITVRDFVTRQFAASGITRGWPSTPFPLAMLSATVFEGAYRLLGFTGQPALNRYGIVLLGRELHYSCEKAKRLLGYIPQVSIAAGMEELGSWVAAVGGVDGVLRLAAG